MRETKNLSSFEDVENAKDPLLLFSLWFQDALQVIPEQANITSLATSSRSGHPSVRMVLLKDFSRKGFVFHTNYESRKAQEIESIAYGSMLLYWHILERQVRIEGRLKKTSRSISAQYYATRPRDSQLGAHASPQSQIVPSREYLEERYRKFKRKFEGRAVSLPKNWGGYCLVPLRIEFWQQRPHRLHDRFLYTKNAQNKWERSRLAP